MNIANILDIASGVFLGVGIIVVITNLRNTYRARRFDKEMENFKDEKE